jgi:predicted ATP-dependent endonuclease of OLD family
MQRPEVNELKQIIERVLRLFSPDPDHPELQAQEIRDLQDRINKRLNEVISGIVTIKTSDIEIEPMILPSTTLMLRDRPDSIPTPVGHQGHGLQRTLIMTLLQILAEIQAETTPAPEGEEGAVSPVRPVVLAVEEPELYMHPQMERKMRDVLYRLAARPGFQVICTTHSPVFLDVARPHKTIVRVVKGIHGAVRFFQVINDIFAGEEAEPERERLRLVANFHPTVNEVFFAKRVVLLEERSALVAFERAAELVGTFDRHPGVRREVTLVDCDGKTSIPLFQRVLNQFQIPYTVIHDEDRGNPNSPGENERIANLLGGNRCHMIGPIDLEAMLGYETRKKGKVYRAFRKVEELYESGSFPPDFLTALNWLYFGQDTEPPSIPAN